MATGADGRALVEGGEREGRTRLIGLELRIHDAENGMQEEVAVFPLDLQVRSSYRYGAVTFNVTLHTSKGDVTIDSAREGAYIP